MAKEVYLFNIGDKAQALYYECNDKAYGWYFGLETEGGMSRLCSGSHIGNQLIAEYAIQKLEKIYSKAKIDLPEKISHTPTPGFFYPRVWRPGWHSFSTGDDEPKRHIELAKHKANYARTLIKKLMRLFEVVEPSQGNLGVYGHEIRSLLILICTEVEANFVGILGENNYKTSKHLKTSDYVKLSRHLDLDSFSVKYVSYSGIEKFSPFSDWDDSRPTQSLPWYEAYNKVKHDSESELSKATLKATINALAALLILLRAQFGPNRDFWEQYPFHEVLVTRESPIDISKRYIPPEDTKNWEEAMLSTLFNKT